MKRCIAYRQLRTRPEVLVPCTDKPATDWHGKVGRFCAEHARAYRELLVGILNETCEHRKIELDKVLSESTI